MSFGGAIGGTGSSLGVYVLASIGGGSQADIPIQAFDQLLISDSLTYIGGDPDFIALFDDSMGQNDSLLIGIGLVFSDTINNLADAQTNDNGTALGLNAFDSNAANWNDALVTSFAGVFSQDLSDTLNNLSDALSTAVAIPLLTVTVADTLNNWLDSTTKAYSVGVIVEDIMKMSDDLFSNGYRLGVLLAKSDTLNNFSDSASLDLQTKPSFNDDLNNLSDAVAVQLSNVLSVTATDTLLMTDHATVVRGNGFTNLDYITRLRRYLNDT